MSSDSIEPPPSADPGSDPKWTLRAIQDSEPKLGCLGRTVSGTGAILAMGGLALVIIYLVGRCGSRTPLDLEHEFSAPE